MFRHLITAAAFVGALTVATAATASPLNFHVFLNTAPLMGSAGPFSLNFTLTNGTPAPNTAIISNFLFGGGAPSGPAFLTGGASGSLSSSVTLTDTEFFNDFFQDFVPGTSLQFDVQLTENVGAGSPDALSFFLFGADGFPIDTDGPGDALFLVNLNGSSFRSVQTFQNPAIGAAVATPTVPEPASLMLLGSGLAAAGFRRIRRAVRAPGR